MELEAMMELKEDLCSGFAESNQSLYQTLMKDNFYYIHLAKGE